jgi:hypothetical protein
MTTITFTKQDIKRSCFDTVSINGRKVLSGRLEGITNTGNGEWKGKASGYDFTIFGGRAAGGASNEWFVQWELEGKHDFIKVTSAKAAIDWINGQ